MPNVNVDPKPAERSRFFNLKAISARPPHVRDARTVGDAMEAYLADAALRIGTTTVQTYRTIIENHINPYLGNRRAQSITRAEIVARMTKMSDPSGPDVDPAGDRTIQLAYQRLKAVIEPDVAHMAPGEHPIPPRGGPRVTEAEIPVWNAEEADRFEEGLKNDPHKALVLVALATGIRQGEALGLFWGDLDPTGRVIHIARSRSRSAGRATKSPKTASGRRNVELPSHAVAALNRHRESQIARNHGVGPGDPIFTGPDGGPLSASAAYHALQRIIERLGLKRISFHALRHTMTTLMMARDVPVNIVRAVLGHSDPTLLLKRYAHLIPGYQAAAAAAMEAAFNGPQEPEKATETGR